MDKTNIQELFLWIKEIGGYFKRFRGGALAPWIDGVEGTPEMDLEARFTQAFFEVGASSCSITIKLPVQALARQESFHGGSKGMRCHIIRRHFPFSGCPCVSFLLMPEVSTDGSALRVSFMDHVPELSTNLNFNQRDTRVLLCATNGGDVHAMTDNHHADTRVESARLRRMMGTALIADSFGETRLDETLKSFSL